MSHQDKIRVAVLYGGRSGEHEVSLMSATNVIQNLDRSRFEVIPIGIDKEGAWFLGDDSYKNELTTPFRLELQRGAERLLFNPHAIGKQLPQLRAADFIPQLKNSERLFDVIFPVIHGPLCEDGTVQGLLELANVPYVGCGVLASAVGMDKDVSKRLMMHAGISVPPFIVIHKGGWMRNPESYCQMISEQFSYPVFIKPANTGSSVGIQKVKCAADLVQAVQNAFQYDLKVVVEKAIDALEIEVAVLESAYYGEDPIVSVAGEIEPVNHEFYSYEAKYLDDDGYKISIPAPISDELHEEIRKVAKQVFQALDCEGMSRVDLFLERGTNQIYFNEINSIPGFTQISMYPKLMEASGIGYSELLTRLVMLALARYERKSMLSREYVAEV